jgi:hypothetical protein
MRRRQISPGEARKETRAVWAILIFIGIVIAVAAYYYFTGEWDQSPAMPSPS